MSEYQLKQAWSVILNADMLNVYLECKSYYLRKKIYILGMYNGNMYGEGNFNCRVDYAFCNFLLLFCLPIFKQNIQKSMMFV